jgi:GNAT superfamily N-acetyltransferase
MLSSPPEDPGQPVPDIISPASTDRDFAAFALMVREYVDWCRIRYAHDSWFVDAAFSHQSLDEEIEAGFPSYKPPKGRALIARREGTAVGCVAYRRLSNGICEMKRLFVRSNGQGHGTGRRLCLDLIEQAREDGYGLMRLDTANLLTEAIALYRSLGFRDCVPYNEYPDEVMRYVVFMELPLQPGAR